ncbi:hypothetical protein HDV01_001587, partial [Terramyces sp. JEL0728]
MSLDSIILLGLANALLLVEGEYFSNNCQGPPDNIYVFDTQYAFDFLPWSPDLNETWAPYFKFHDTSFTVGSPGAEFVPLPGQTCASSLDFADSAPYYSGYTLFYTGGYALDAVPK